MTITTLRTLIRILCFAVLFYLIFDTLFILFKPFDAIEPYSIYGTVLPLQQRLFDFSLIGPQVVAQPVPLDTLFAANIISRPRASDEFRVALIGDSGVMGSNNSDAETISALLTSEQGAVLGKHIVVYNLGWPTSRLTKDLLIADAALAYRPDMFIWLVTPLYMDQHAPENRDDGGIIEFNSERLAVIAAKTGLDTSYTRAYAHATIPWWQHSVLFERSRIFSWLHYQMDGFSSPLVSRKPIDLKNLNVVQFDPYIHLPDSKLDSVIQSDDWNVLLALSKLTTVPILIVNEPIQVVPDTVPGVDVHYDRYFGRVVYDGYRAKFTVFCRQNQLWCLDLWTLVPPEDYLDAPLHRTGAGNKLIADQLLGAVMAHYSGTQP